MVVVSSSFLVLPPSSLSVILLIDIFVGMSSSKPSPFSFRIRFRLAFMRMTFGSRTFADEHCKVDIGFALHGIRLNE